MREHELIDAMAIEQDGWIELRANYPQIAGRALSLHVIGEKPVDIGSTSGGEPTGQRGSFETWHPGPTGSFQYSKCIWVRGRGSRIEIWALGNPPRQ
jgi:hypothetical protein